jgi:thiosulfate/3-mercaptopyruvate sulfurtransferase
MIEILIETNELAAMINSEKLKQLRILDCSWFMPAENKNVPELFRKERIPYSQLFDIDEIADKSTGLPHMMPNNEVFISFMKKMDVRKSDHIICYDRAGIFSAPRVWLTFKLFGAKDVSILNGGFPMWLSHNLTIEKGDCLKIHEIKRNPHKADDFDYNLDNSRILNADQILLQSAKQFAGEIQEHIIDCRAAPRYKGEVEEPRPTLRKGHILTASNVFFKDLLDSQSCYKSKEDIKKEFEKKKVDIEKKLTLYCGSGITASVDIFALALLGKFDNCRIYDGSWAEMVKYV